MASPAKLHRNPSARTSKPPRIEVDWGLAYEALIGLIMFLGEEHESTYEVGPPWFRSVRRKASPELRRAARGYKDHGHLFTNLAGLVRDAEGRSIDRFVARLRGDRVGEVQRVLLAHDRAKADLADAALRGDAAARREFLEQSESRSAEKRILEVDPRALAREVADLVELWHRDVFSDLAPALERGLRDSWRSISRLKDQLPAERLIVRATRGVEYRVESWIHTVALVPSVLNRPWVTLAEHRGAKIIFYPAVAAGEGSDAQLADVYKALGDETRLRILRLLASGMTSLTDIADRLGLAKSTVHGHMVILRTAGLTRSVVGDGVKGYVLNERPDLNSLFDTLLKG
jgi:DNA-binding transcriptional ArsR family regulator